MSRVDLMAVVHQVNRVNDVMGLQLQYYLFFRTQSLSYEIELETKLPRSELVVPWHLRKSLSSIFPTGIKGAYMHP